MKSASPNQPQVQGLSREASVRVLPADVYDALELAAEAFGGIGAGSMAEGNKTWNTLLNGTACPNCAIGTAFFLDGDFTGEVRTALHGARLSTSANDNAVALLNRRAGRRTMNRVPFADWCAELHIVRGDT